MPENRAHCDMKGSEKQTLYEENAVYDIVFVNPPNHCQEDFIPLGLRNLHTIIDGAGYRTRFMDLQKMFIHGELQFTADCRDQIHEMISTVRATVYAFTVWNTSFPWVVDMCRFIKTISPQTVTLIGGPMSTLLSEKIVNDYEAIDIACQFEGETIITPLVQTLISGDMAGLETIPNIVYRKKDGTLTRTDPAPLIDNLDTLPQIPVTPREFKDPVVNLEAGRGCSFHCYYCSSCFIWQFKPRYKSGARLFSEIENICRAYTDIGEKAPVFHLEHDNFLMNPRVLNELDQKVRETGLSFNYGFAGRADLITPKNLELLKRTGCAYVYLGIETGSVRMQKITRKNLLFPKVFSAIRNLQERSIMVHANLMYGFPEERIEDLYDTLDMINTLRFLGVHVHVSMLSPEMCTPVGDAAQPSDYLFNETSRYVSELTASGFDPSDYDAVYLNHLYTLDNSHYNLPEHHKFIQFWHPLVTAYPMIVHTLIHKNPWSWDRCISSWRHHLKSMPLVEDSENSIKDLFRIFDDSFGHDPQEIRILEVEHHLARNPSPSLARDRLADYYRHFGRVRRDILADKEHPTQNHESRLHSPEGLTT